MRRSTSWSTRYIFLSKEEAQREFEKARRRFWQGRKSLLTLLKETVTKEESALVDNASAGKAGDVDRALEEIGNDIVSYGIQSASLRPDFQLPVCRHCCAA